jgi:hypothetical protein
MARQESRDESSRFEFAARLVDAVMRGLPGDPVGEFGKAGAKILHGDKPDLLLGLSNRGEAVPDIAGAELSGHLGSQIVAIHSLCEANGNIFDRLRSSAADVEHLADGGGMFEGDQKRAPDIFHMHEVATQRWRARPCKGWIAPDRGRRR